MLGQTRIPGNIPFFKDRFGRAVLAALLALVPVVAFAAASAEAPAGIGTGDGGVLLAARPAGGLPQDEKILPGKADDLVLRTQKALALLGHYHGPQDGRMNPDTAAAVRLYQKSTGLRVTGRVTRKLVENLEHGLQVRVLLKRLDKVRIENMSAARKALLSHPTTRDLVTGTRDEVADPTRDPTACFDNVTVRCLVTEALESAKAIFKPELRDWALGEILVAQARAGLGDQAKKTASRIRDPRLIMVALRDIAKAQAASGRSAEALASAEIIPDPLKQAEALAAIADIQVRRGDHADARDTTKRLLSLLGDVSDPLKRVSFRTRVAVILAKAGDAPGAANVLAEAEAIARARADRDGRSVALRYVAIALAEMAQPDQAINVLSDVTDDSNRTPVLISAATQQARAGDAAAALATADSIESVRYRAVVLGRIALAQAELGDLAASEITLEMALAAIEKIEFPFAHSYAVSRVSLAMAGIGKVSGTEDKVAAIFGNAVETAAGIDDNRLRAHTLWTIAAEQIRAGDDAGAQETKELAEKATDEIKSTLSRVWMFSDIASVHAVAGEQDAAWAAFDHGLKVARAIENAWGRARALGKLAATLIELVDPGKGLPPQPL